MGLEKPVFLKLCHCRRAVLVSHVSLRHCRLQGFFAIVSKHLQHRLVTVQDGSVSLRYQQSCPRVLNKGTETQFGLTKLLLRPLLRRDISEGDDGVRRYD